MSDDGGAALQDCSGAAVPAAIVGAGSNPDPTMSAACDMRTSGARPRRLHHPSAQRDLIKDGRRGRLPHHRAGKAGRHARRTARFEHGSARNGKFAARLERGKEGLERGRPSLERGRLSLERERPSLEREKEGLERGREGLERGTVRFERCARCLERGAARFGRGAERFARAEARFRCGDGGLLRGQGGLRRRDQRLVAASRCGDSQTAATFARCRRPAARMGLAAGSGSSIRPLRPDG